MSRAIWASRLRARAFAQSEGLSTGGNGSGFPSSRPKRQSDLIVFGARISTGSLSADPSEATARQPMELRWSL
jgi:hypothetical protein